MSNIEWTNKTWNPVTGCNKVSQGCKHCYAEVMHKRLQGMGQQKYQQDFLKGAVVHYDSLIEPMKWKKPVMIFVNSMSDLFHEDVPFEFIDMVFAVMKNCHWHTFQIVTKRTKRMLEWYRRSNFYSKLDDAYLHMMQEYSGMKSRVCYQQNGYIEGFPLPNVWILVSIENQAAADERIPDLLQVPAVVRGLSMEPLLGPVKLSHAWTDPCGLPECGHCGGADPEKKIHWVITGGESGHKARPSHPDWFRSLRDQCAAAGVPFFFKQWGEWVSEFHHASDSEKHSPSDIFVEHVTIDGIADYKGEYMFRVGKKAAGNLLDGKKHLNFPNTNNG